MDYLYDGSFEGLLTAIYHSYYQESATGIYPLDHYQYSLLNRFETVPTDEEKAGKVYTAIESKISREALRHSFYTYLSNHPAKENLILRYLQLGFKLGSKVDHDFSHPSILPIRAISKKVSFEAHRFMGLLRFAEAGNALYAAFEPDHHILILLADHFADRLAGENFIIHDKRRSLAIVYNRTEWLLTDLPHDLHVPLTESELYYQSLWTKYFDKIAIQSRKNSKLQTQFVPRRYQHNLIEFK